MKTSSEEANHALQVGDYLYIGCSGLSGTIGDRQACSICLQMERSPPEAKYVIRLKTGWWAPCRRKGGMRIPDTWRCYRAIQKCCNNGYDG